MAPFCYFIWSGVADLNKEFEVPPYSQTVVEGGQVELRCHPPPGRPAPALSWTRDGQPVQGSNFLQAADGHLIVVQARRQDAGNYR